MARRTALDGTLEVWRQIAENTKAVERWDKRARRSYENATAAVQAAIERGEKSSERIEEVFMAARDATIIAAMEELPACTLSGKELEILEIVEPFEFTEAKPGL